ncbi:MAG: DUF968 domain-containing protein [Oricola sp.]
MSGFRIPYPNEQFSAGKKTAPVKRDSYKRWIATLPCVITKSYGVQVAHLSFSRPELGHLGRGKQTKASDRWVLPLAVALHEEQHAGSEREFWRRYGIDPHIACLVLFGIWSDYGRDATEHAERIIKGGIRL